MNTLFTLVFVVIAAQSIPERERGFFSELSTFFESECCCSI